MSDQPWIVYVLLVDNHKFYTGATTDLKRRLREHASGKGAKCLRGAKSLSVVAEYLHVGPDAKSRALKMEARIKKMSRKRKEKFLGYKQSS